MFADSVRVTPQLQVNGGFCTHQSSQDIFRMPKDNCVMGAHLQRVVVEAIRKTGSVKAFLLEKYVHSACSDYMQQIVTKYFEDPQLGRWDTPNSCSILRELFSSSHPTVTIMDLHWPVCVQCLGDMYLNNEYELYHTKLTCVSTYNASEKHNIFDLFFQHGAALRQTG